VLALLVDKNLSGIFLRLVVTKIERAILFLEPRRPGGMGARISL
jgi:hypothetical protein